MSPLKKLLLVCIIINIFYMFWIIIYPSKLFSLYSSISVMLRQSRTHALEMQSISSVNDIQCKIDIINTGCHITNKKNGRKWFTDPCLFILDNDVCYSIDDNNVPLPHRYYIGNKYIFIYGVITAVLYFFIGFISNCLLYYIYFSIDRSNDKSIGAEMSVLE